jgi:p-aminobenzoyl-glutamate transporter AbgT
MPRHQLELFDILAPPILGLVCVLLTSSWMGSLRRAWRFEPTLLLFFKAVFLLITGFGYGLTAVVEELRNQKTIGTGLMLMLTAAGITFVLWFTLAWRVATLKANQLQTWVTVGGHGWRKSSL